MSEKSIKERISALEADQKRIAEALKRLNDLLIEESGEEIVKTGEVICGVTF